MIEVKNLSVGYEGCPVLQDVSLAAQSGEVTTILGPNGCGKSTLLKCIVGALKPAGGEVFIDGTSASSFTSAQLARKVAYLPQSKNVPDIAADRLVLHGRFPYLSYPRHYRKEDFDIAKKSMEQLGVSHLAGRPVAELSGGMRQNVYLSMALAQQTPVILMDEPTTYLDIPSQYHFAQLARSLSRQGKTVVLVLHDILLALKISDRIAVLSGGSIVGTGTPDEILSGSLLQQVYGIRIGTAVTSSGTQYYYDLEDPK